MSASTAATMRRLLAFVLVAAVSGNAGENNQTKREIASPFLSDVIKRIDTDRRQVARPVQDLQVALDRIAEIFGSEAANEDDTPVFELPENAQVETLDTSSTIQTNAVFPTAPTGTNVPPPINGLSTALTPQELQALYRIAVQKGLNLDLSAIQGGVVPAPASSQGTKASLTAIAGPTPVPPTSTGSTSEPAQSYYYYFVPIKNPNGPPQKQTTQALMNQPNAPQNSDSHAAVMASSAANHAANAAASAALMAGGADRAVEPLFMAMAGFVGMALMFVASVLFLPKLGALRSLKNAPNEVASISKLVLQSIEGKDCSERLTCEIGRAARTLKLGGKPLRVLELCLPPPMAVQISRIRRAVARKEKCNFIPCKFRRPPNINFPPKKPLLKPPFKPSLFKPQPKPPLRPVREEHQYKPEPTPTSIFGIQQTEHPDYPEYPEQNPEVKWSTHRPPQISSRPNTLRPPTSPKPPTSTRAPYYPEYPEQNPEVKWSTHRPPQMSSRPITPRPPTSPKPPTSTRAPDYPEQNPVVKWSTHRPPQMSSRPITPRPPTSPKPPKSTRAPAPERAPTSPRTPTSPRPPPSLRPFMSPKPHQQKKNPKISQPQSREPRIRRL